MSFRLGNFNDIPIVIHWSFSLLFLGAVGVLVIVEGINTGILYGMGILALFTAVLLHEFMHAAVAKRFGYPTEEIVLYPLGGASKIKEIPTEPKQEFLIAFFGPLTNFVIAAIIGGLAFLLSGFLDFSFLDRNFLELVYLYALLNIGLGLFNLLVPALPMDGGRVLRSILSTQMPYPKATIISINISRVIAILMGIVGFFVNPWLLFIAFFIWVAGSSEMEESITMFLLEGVEIKEVMDERVATISASTTVEDLLDEMIESGNLGYLVMDSGGKPIGVVSLTDIKEVPHERRVELLVSQIMTPNIVSLKKETATAKDALQLMREEEYSRVYVTSNGDIKGQVRQTDIVKFVQIKGVKKQVKGGGQVQGDPIAESQS